MDVMPAVPDLLEMAIVPVTEPAVEGSKLT
jgi:hypothetical protein